MDKVDKKEEADKKITQMSEDIASYEEIELRMIHDFKVKNVHAVDVVSIGTKSDPIPMKDIDDERRMMGLEDEGKYCGHNPIIST